MFVSDAPNPYECFNESSGFHQLMKEEYANHVCAICSAPADGLHYGAVSCRSCNAFFRRTVVEKAEYQCKYSRQCIIDADGRCSCRYCRFQKCLTAGMKTAAVQPRRDPTGSQKDRRKRTYTSESRSASPVSMGCSMPGSTLLDAMQSNSLSFELARLVGDNDNGGNSVRAIKSEVVDDEQFPSTSQDSSNSTKLTNVIHVKPGIPTPEQGDYQEFFILVHAYRDHMRMMQLNFTDSDKFLAEIDAPPPLTEMDPKEVDKLSKVELAGLLFWTEKMRPFKTLPAEDRSNLLKRYSVRKLSLDHFYGAASYPEMVKKRTFVMNNYTYVLPSRTGFEMPDEDEKQITAKRETFAPTFNRFWSNVIVRFVEMEITDAEIVYLQIMLLWSVSHNEHVSEPTREVMTERRNWAMKRLFEWYASNRRMNSDVRFGEITLLLGEIETICDMHCQDFQVARLFEFVDMSQFWYESLCYTPLNTNKVGWDANLMENLKRLACDSVCERIKATEMLKHTKDDPMESSPQSVPTLAPDDNSHNCIQSSDVMMAPSSIGGLLTPSPEENNVSSPGKHTIVVPSSNYHHYNA